MRKIFTHFSILTILLAASLTSMANNAYAAPSAWSQLTSWFKSKNAAPTAEAKPATETTPAAKPKIQEKTSPITQPNEPVSPAAPMKSMGPLTPVISETPTQPNSSGWSKLNQWGKQIAPEWISEKNQLPAAHEGVPYHSRINLSTFIKDDSGNKSKLIFTLDKSHPQWLQLSADGQFLEGNGNKVKEPANQIEIGIAVANSNTKHSGGRQLFKMAIDHQAAQPQWDVHSFPNVAINQKNYANINLNDYVSSNINQDSFIYSLTPGKTNPDWVNLQANGLLHISAEKISPEDIDTTQIIYITATSSRSGKSTPAEITIKITANDQLAAPEWQPYFKLHDAIPNQNYQLDLAAAVNTQNLQDNDQLVFQLISSSANWLQVGDNGFSLVAKKIPEDAANKYYEIIVRVTSKMSGKSNDFNGRIYVNSIPQPLQWQAISAATLNKNYSLDLAHSVSSNIKNDQFIFHIDIATLPHWLSIQNNRILSGIPQEAALLDHPQKVEVYVKSLVSGMTSKQTLIIPIKPDNQLTPQWKQGFFSNPIIGEAYRSDDLTMVLDNRYPHDQLNFEYVSGPEWLGFNSLCHCLASKGNVPDEAAGKSFSLKLRVHSKASGKSLDYEQNVMVYVGLPVWTQTSLPEVKIAQGASIAIPLKDYTQDDISGDKFTYALDQYHSPRWVNLGIKGDHAYLVINPAAISTNEVGTTQSVRLLATSQSTHKTSVQLLTINVKANPGLAAPAWKNIALNTATVGVSHVVDLTQYIQNSVADDRLTITLGSDSPSWLSIKDNRLMGIPPRDQIGGPYTVHLRVYSQATDTTTVMQTPLRVQLVVVAEDNMEIHSFYDNHQSIVIRGLKKNHKYQLAEVKGSHFDYGPFYSPHPIKSGEDWDGNPFYAVGNDKMIETGDDGTVSIVYYTLANTPPPQFDLVVLR